MEGTYNSGKAPPQLTGIQKGGERLEPAGHRSRLTEKKFTQRGQTSTSSLASYKENEIHQMTRAAYASRCKGEKKSVTGGKGEDL